MLEKEKLIQDIRSGLAYLQQYVSFGGKLNLTDTNIHSEDFVAGLLNIIYDWNLVNANQETANFPCIDLIDSTLKLGLQVTSEKGSSKLKKTIQCLKKHKLSNKISSLRVFTLKPKQKMYKVDASCPGIEFNWRSHVIDFEDMIGEAHKIQDLARLKKLHEYVVISVPIFQQLPKSALPLYIPSTEKESASLAFSSRSTSLVGRKRELDQLSKFLLSDQKYSWWLVTGSAGSGKSRLALELCEQYKNNGWEVGFLSRTESGFSWANFRPIKNTLIVVDYVSNRTETVSDTIIELSRWSQGFDKAVRVLLLERDKGSWWRKFSREESLSEESEILANQYNTPLVLSGLSEKALLKMAKELILLHKGVWTTAIELRLLKWLNKHGIRNLPLYVMIFSEFPNVEKPEELLRRVLKKEASRRHSHFRDSVPPKQIDNLLFLTTMTGGLLPKSYSFRFLANSDIEDLVPNISTLDNELYCNITGSPQGIKYLPGLQPDLLGEQYVLDCLNREGLDVEMFHRLLLAAYEFQPDGALTFAIKSFFDFPNDPNIHKFFKLPNDSTTFRLVKARLVSQVMVNIRCIIDDFLQQQLKDVIEAADAYPEERELQKNTALAEYNFACCLAFSGRLPFPYSIMLNYSDREAKAIDRFDAVLSRVGEDSQLGIMALMNRGTLQKNENEEALSAFTTVIHSQYASDETRACAYNNRASIYLEQNDHDLAIADRSEVLLLSETSPDRRFVALFRGGESYSAIGNHAQTADNMTKILSSKDISENDKLFAKLMRAVSYHFMGERTRSHTDLENMIDHIIPKITNSNTKLLLREAEMARRAGLLDKASKYLKEAKDKHNETDYRETEVSLRISNVLLLEETENKLADKNEAWQSLHETICSAANKRRLSRPNPI